MAAPNMHIVIEVHLGADATILNPDRVGQQAGAKIHQLLEETYGMKGPPKERVPKTAEERQVSTIVISHRLAQVLDTPE